MQIRHFSLWLFSLYPFSHPRAVGRAPPPASPHGGDRWLTHEDCSWLNSHSAGGVAALAPEAGGGGRPTDNEASVILISAPMGTRPAMKRNGQNRPQREC